ncbi:MAG: glycosyltransferase family 4 protein [Pseudohongiellaceae bacterium]
MKLAFLIYNYFPYGGQQRDFHRIVQECIHRGHQVSIYTMKWQGPPLPEPAIHFAPIKAVTRLGLYRKFTSWVHLALAADPHDLVIGFNRMPGLDVYFAADPCFAEKAASQRAGYYRFTPRYKHFRDYEEAVFGASSKTRVFILSPLQRHTFEKHYPACGTRLTLVPPGVDRDRMITADAARLRKEFRHKFMLTEDQLLVLQIGSGFRVKGVDRSLRAIAALPESLRKRVHYYLIGQDKPGPYLRLARRLGLTDQFVILPGRDDIPRFLLGADLLLHPAYSESAGYVLLEATIAGLPVLTTATCGYAFHIQNARSGQVCPEPFSQTDLDARLEEMLTSTRRQNWSENGIAYGRQEELYSLAQTATDHIERFASER